MVFTYNHGRPGWAARWSCTGSPAGTNTAKDALRTARDIRSRRRWSSREDLVELTELLRGESVTVAGSAAATANAPTLHAAPGKLSERYSLTTLVDRMNELYATSLDMVVAADAVWSALPARIDLPRRRAPADRRLAHSVGVRPGEHPAGDDLERITRTLTKLREQVVSFRPQPVITEDNLVVEIDTVLYFQVTDPRAAAYEIANYIQAVEQLTVTTLRNVVGSMDLEKTLTSRDTINSQLRGVLDEATGKWGIRVNRVEIKAIDPPKTIKDAMEKQMRAERRVENPRRPADYDGTAASCLHVHPSSPVESI